MEGRAADNSRRNKIKRYALRTAIFCISIFALAMLATFCLRQKENAVPPINPTPSVDGGLNYPYKLVPGDRTLDFPASEGRLLNMDSDTWFLEGVLKGKETGHRYSFIAVYFVSRIFGIYPFDFYSFTLYDLDSREYGTFTTYGKVNASTGYLNLTFPLPEQDAVWTTLIDKSGYLVPFSYKINFPGVDQNGKKMSLISNVTAMNPPVAVGADIYNGKITVLKQENTFSYFQTGLQFDGKLSWGDRSEAVIGQLGHIDRQMFPKFSGVNGSRDGRNLSHEWRTYFLDNGLDFSSWRQFDRDDHNTEYSFGGATTFDPVNGARYFGDVSYETMSYVRTENNPIQPKLKPRASVLYFPSRHRISSPALDLQLLAEPLIKTPLIAFPIEYMHGPVMLSGTMAGKPFKGIGSLEVTLALYRNFELVKVLSDSVKYLPAEAVLPNGTPLVNILNTIFQVGGLINSKNSATAIALANGRLRTEINGLAEPYKDQMLQILEDLIAVM